MSTEIEEIQKYLDGELTPKEEEIWEERLEEDEELYRKLLDLIAEREEQEVKKFWMPIDRMIQRHRSESKQEFFSPSLVMQGKEISPSYATSVPLSRAAAGIAGEINKEGVGEAEEIWVSSPHRISLGQNFALWTAHNERKDKILVYIYSTIREYVYLEPVRVTFQISTLVAPQGESFTEILSPYREDPSSGLLLFDLGRVSYIQNPHVTIGLSSPQFSHTVVHSLMDVRS